MDINRLRGMSEGKVREEERSDLRILPHGGQAISNCANLAGTIYSLLLFSSRCHLHTYISIYMLGISTFSTRSNQVFYTDSASSSFKLSGSTYEMSFVHCTYGKTT